MPSKIVQVPGVGNVEFPDTMSDDQIASAIKGHYTSIANTSGGNEMSAQPSPWSWAGIKKTLYEAADKTTNALPAIGGVIGGVLGAGGGGTVGSVVPGPGTVGGGTAGAIGGAGLGGMIGQAVRQPLREAIFPDEQKLNMGDAANAISLEGVKQAGYEAGGRALQAGGKLLAPRIAEAAVAPGKRLLKSIPENSDIGQTILNETSAYTPGKIAGQLETKIGAERAAKVAAMRDAGSQGIKVSLATPQDLSTLEVEKAITENVPEYIKGAEKVRDQMTLQMGKGGKPIPIVDAAGKPTGNFVTLPDNVDPARFDALRQGVDRTIGSFDPSVASALDPLRKQIRGNMARSLHDAVPATVSPDARMAEMIPAQEAAWNTSFNPGVTRNVFERFARPTGALAGMIGGSYAGKEAGGAPGAAAGGVAGLAAPLLLTSPTGMMFAARMVNGKLVAQLIRGARVTAPLVESQMNNKPR